jgi:hypothetical protein
MLATVAPKSDQLNADDLIGRTMTIKVREVTFKDSKDQPVFFYFEGDENKPYKPCLSMRRVIIKAWGADANYYIGRCMTLYCDETVRFGKEQVGGIRISHMSHIDRPVEMALTVTRGVRKPYRVEPLAGAPSGDNSQRDDNGAREVADDLIRRANAADGPDALRALAAREAIIKRRDWLRTEAPDIADEVDDAFRIKEPAETATPDNPTAQEGRSDEDMGEGFNDEAPAWRGVVDAHLDSIRKLETLIDVKGAVNQFAATKRGLPDDVIADIEAAENNALMRFSTAAAG